jgi:hypothetical protein
VTVTGQKSEGRSNPRRPAYELPLGRLVPPDHWEASMGERQLRPIPPCTSELIVRETAGGLDLRYRTLGGLDRVTAQMAFDFPPGGVWETADTRLEPRAGQVIFLRRGAGAMRYGSDVIQIGSGADAHRTWHMRHAEEAPEHVRSADLPDTGGSHDPLAGWEGARGFGAVIIIAQQPNSVGWYIVPRSPRQ